jgi:hypothetical protein
MIGKQPAHAAQFFRSAMLFEGDACVLWPFAVGSHGYPALTEQKRTYALHRRICEEVHGPPPAPGPKAHAAHACAQKRCINKRHIRWKTPRENSLEHFHPTN